MARRAKLGVPPSITTIGIRAFEGGSGLTSFAISDNVTNLGTGIPSLTHLRSKKSVWAFWAGCAASAGVNWLQPR